LAAVWILFGHQLIEAMYEGKSMGFLNRIIEGQATHPVEHYIALGDKVMQQGFYALLFFVSFLSMIYYFLVKINPLSLNHSNIKPFISHEPANIYSIFRKLSPDLILICFLMIASIKFTYGLENVMDIRLFDESSYLYGGVNLAERGFPAAQLAPLYAIWYYLLSLFMKNNVQLYYLSYKILVSCTTLAFYVYLRRVGIVPFVSVVAAFLYLISKNCFVWPYVTLFALLVLLLFLILASFVRLEESYYWVVGLGILMISFIRPEYFISFILFCLVFLFLILKKLKSGLLRPKLALSKVVIILSILLILTHMFGMPGSSGSRKWWAFGQHFSLNFVRWNNLSINPWTNWPEIVKSVFGEANTIIDAARSNRKEFVRHISHNAIRYPRASIKLLLIGPYWVTPLFGKLINRTELLFFIIIALGLFIKRKNIAKISCGKTVKHLTAVAVVIAMPAFLSATFIYPRDHYLIIQGMMAMALFSYFVSVVIVNTGKEKMGVVASLLIGLLILSLTPIPESGWSLTGSKQRGTQRVLKNRSIIKFIQSLGVVQRVNMLEASGRYNYYSGDNYYRVAEYSKKEPFYDFIQTQQINMIVITKSLKKDTRFVNDDEFKLFLKNPQKLNFVKLEIPDTGAYLLVKDELLK